MGKNAVPGVCTCVRVHVGRACGRAAGGSCLMRVAAARSAGERESSCRAAAAVDKGVKGYAICGVRVRAQLAVSSERRGASLCKWKAPGWKSPTQRKRCCRGEEQLGNKS